MGAGREREPKSEQHSQCVRGMQRRRGGGYKQRAFKRRAEMTLREFAFAFLEVTAAHRSNTPYAPYRIVYARNPQDSDREPVIYIYDRRTRPSIASSLTQRNERRRERSQRNPQHNHNTNTAHNAMQNIECYWIYVMLFLVPRDLLDARANSGFARVLLLLRKN